MAKRPILSVDQIEVRLLKSNPPQLSVTAYGSVSNPAWREPELVVIDADSELSTDGILDLMLVAEPPGDQIVPQVIQPVSASLVWEKDADRVVVVRVVARLNELSRRVRSDFTTMALGEEVPIGTQPFPFPLPWPLPWPRPMPRPKGPYGEDYPVPKYPIGEDWPPRPTWPIGEDWPRPKPFIGEIPPKPPWRPENPPKPLLGEHWPPGTSPTLDDPPRFEQPQWVDPIPDRMVFGRW